MLPALLSLDRIINVFRAAKVTGLKLREVNYYKANHLIRIFDQYMNSKKTGEKMRVISEHAVLDWIIAETMGDFGYMMDVEYYEPDVAVEKRLPDELLEAWRSSNCDFGKFLKSKVVSDYLRKD